MNFKDNTDNDCPGCSKEIPNYEIKKHIQKCPKYPLTILREVSRFDEHTPLHIIKVLLQ